MDRSENGKLQQRLQTRQRSLSFASQGECKELTASVNLVVRKHMSVRLCLCRNPPPPERGIPNRLVWAVPHSLLLRSKAEDIQAACELAHQPTTIVDRLLTDFERQAATLRRDVQRELDYAQVEGSGLLWGDNPMAQPPTPRCAPSQDRQKESLRN